MSLKASVARSTLWSGVQIAGNQVTAFGVFLVLTRFLTPGEIGIVALAVSFIEILTPLMRAGLPEALIQRPRHDEIEADTCFWSGIGAALLLAAALALLAPAIARAFASPPLAPVLQALAVLLPIGALSATHEARLTRAFGFRALALRTLLGNVVGGAVGVAMAVAGFGVWSLVAQRLVGSAVGVGLIWASYRWIPRPRFSIPAFRGMAGFGMHMTAMSFLMSLNGRIFDFLLGFFLGPAAVGYVRVAARGLDMVTQFAVNPLTAVALPALSRLQQDRAAFGRAFRRMVQTCALMTFPACFGLAIVAPDLVPLVFGPQWRPSGPLLAILCLSAVPITLQYFTWPALAAMGRADQSALGITIIVASAAVLTAIAAPFGLVAVVAAHVLRTYLTLPISLVLLRRHTGVASGGLVKTIAHPLAAAVAMAVVLYAVQPSLAAFGAVPRIALLAGAGVALYGALVFAAVRPLLRDLRTTLRGA